MIYVLVAQTRMTTGHGESGEFLFLAGEPFRELNTYPAFATRAAAEKFLAEKGPYTSYKIHEMELK